MKKKGSLPEEKGNEKRKKMVQGSEGKTLGKPKMLEKLTDSGGWRHKCQKRGLAHQTSLRLGHETSNKLEKKMVGGVGGGE